MLFRKASVLLITMLSAYVYGEEYCSYSSCTSCGATGDGGVSCTTSAYYHNGSSGYSCDDREQPIDTGNFCSVSGQLDTPYGQGDWTAASGCHSGATPGGYAGSIKGDGFFCDCFNADSDDNSEGCGGLQYNCNNVWSCTCS